LLLIYKELPETAGVVLRHTGTLEAGQKARRYIVLTPVWKLRGSADRAHREEQATAQLPLFAASATVSAGNLEKQSPLQDSAARLLQACWQETISAATLKEDRQLARQSLT
jgi:hypothetical protein